MTPEQLTLMGIAAPVFGALLVGIWRFSALATEVKLTLAEIRTKLEEMREKQEHLDKVPELERRLGVVEGAVQHSVQTFVPRLAVLESKVVSMREMRAVRDSRPRIPTGSDE